MNKIFISSSLLLLALTSRAQIMTREDSLRAGLEMPGSNTIIAGYGEVKAEYDVRQQTARANLTRAVLFVGHRFSNKISFFSELEVEDAKVEGGEPGGEIAFEQLYLKFNISKDAYISAGVFTPRIGITNENHLPTTFNGNDRPYVETLVIPATWREIGVSLYGAINRIQGLNYSLALVNGLSSEHFENGSGIREGRFEARNATASNLAVTGALLYYIQNFRLQASGYYGGTAGMSKRDADSLQLESGAFGTPVALYEADVQYISKPFTFRALATQVSIPEADKINRAYSNNTPSAMMGFYAEAGTNLLYFFDKETKKNLTLFARYEMFDLNQNIPANGIENGLNKKNYIVAGLTYHPIHGVVIKADYVVRTTGEPNPALNQNAAPNAPPFDKTNSFVNLGVGYSF